MTALSIPGSFASHRAAVRQLVSFGVIGAASTAAYIALYAWLRQAAPAGISNAVALLITAVANAAANRWLTFGIRGNEGLARHHAAGLAALGAALLITSVSLLALNAIDPRHGRLSELAVLVAANAAATLVRFLLLRTAVRGGETSPASRRPASALPVFANLTQSKRTRG
jgi:putative flippase GtrA